MWVKFTSNIRNRIHSVWNWFSGSAGGELRRGRPSTSSSLYLYIILHASPNFTGGAAAGRCNESDTRNARGVRYSGKWVWLENLKKNDASEDWGLYGKIILKWILKYNGNLGWIILVQDTAIANMAVNNRVASNSCSFLVSWDVISLFRRILLHVVSLCK